MASSLATQWLERYHRNMQDPVWREKERERNRERAKRHPRKCVPSSPARRAANRANVSAKRWAAPGTIYARDVWALWERQPACVACGVGRGVDHIVPMSRGGANRPENLQNLCPRCNARKGAKVPS